MSRRRPAVLVVVAFGALAGPVGVGAAEAPSDSIGSFDGPFAEDPTFNTRPPRTNEESKRVPTAVHMAMMPDGRVLYWGGMESVEDLNGGMALDGGRAITPARSRLLDLRSGTPRWAAPLDNTGGPDLFTDLFCADQRVLLDGRVLAAGGSRWESDPVDLTPATGEGGPGGTIEVKGSAATRWVRPGAALPRWQSAERSRMNRRRWYPTLISLADGRVLAASGVGRLVYNTEPLEGAEGTIHNVRRLETFNPRTNRWTEEPSSGDVSLPLYPRLHLTHDGKVLYAGSGIMWSPFGESGDEALWNLHQAYDPQTHRWSVAGVGAMGARSDPISVPLMLEAPYDRTRILLAGGTLGVSPTTYLATTTSEIVTYKGGATRSEITGDLRNARWFSSGVLLPSGEVLALAGGDKNANVGMGTDAAVHQVELFDPETRRWRPLASSRRDRTYHNTAILLPDARVLLGGHAPQPAGQQDHATSSAGVTASNLKDPSFEVFAPPYLDPARGPRPRIAWAKAGLAAGGGAYLVRVQGDVERLVLMRLPSTTHVMDADQRGIELQFERAGEGALRVRAPSREVAPSGVYYLFAISGSGVPSKARIVKVAPGVEALGMAPAPFGE